MGGGGRRVLLLPLGSLYPGRVVCGFMQARGVSQDIYVRHRAREVGRSRGLCKRWQLPGKRRQDERERGALAERTGKCFLIRDGSPFFMHRGGLTPYFFRELIQ